MYTHICMYIYIPKTATQRGHSPSVKLVPSNSKPKPINPIWVRKYPQLTNSNNFQCDAACLWACASTAIFLAAQYPKSEPSSTYPQARSPPQNARVAMKGSLSSTSNCTNQCRKAHGLSAIQSNNDRTTQDNPVKRRWGEGLWPQPHAHHPSSSKTAINPLKANCGVERWPQWAESRQVE